MTLGKLEILVETWDFMDERWGSGRRMGIRMRTGIRMARLTWFLPVGSYFLAIVFQLNLSALGAGA